MLLAAPNVYLILITLTTPSGLFREVTSAILCCLLANCLNAKSKCGGKPRLQYFKRRKDDALMITIAGIHNLRECLSKLFQTES